MAVNPLIGPVFVASELENAVLVVLKEWLPYYLQEIEQQIGATVGSTPRPAHYDNRNALDAIPGENIPKVVCVSPGLIGSPNKSGDGSYRAIWRVGVGAAVGAMTEEEANQHVKVYGAAIRAALLQEPNTKGRITWIDETYVDLPLEGQLQQYRSANVWFAIEVYNVVTQRRGPMTQDQESLGPAQSVTADPVVKRMREAMP